MKKFSSEVLLNDIWERLVFLRFEWKQYRELFGHSEDRMNRLNQIAPSFFYVVHKAMLISISLGISRLTDRDQKKFASLDTLEKKLRDEGALSIADSNQLATMIIALKQKAMPIILWRHTEIAHRALSRVSNPIPSLGFSLADIENILERNRQILNFVSSRILKTGLEFESIGPKDDAEAFVKHLGLA